MSKGKRYDGEAKLNYKKVFAVIIACIVLVMVVIIIKNVLTKAKNTTPLTIVNYFALHQDNKWGILGSDGQVVIDPMYQEMPIVINKSKDVFLCTYDVNEETGEYKTKVINKENNEIWTEYDKIEALENYDEAGNVWYEEDILRAEQDGLWGLINLDGEVIVAPSYENIETLKGIENSLIVKKDGLCGLVNNKGTQIIPTEYKEIQNFGDEYKKGYITVNQNNQYGLVNYSGEQILENKYEKIYKIYSDKYFVIEESGKQKLINKQGETILAENFDEIKQIANSGIVFVKNNKYGLMNFEGTITIENIYENLNEINTDIFSAKKDSKVGIIDIQKNEKTSFIYEKISYNTKAGVYIADDENYHSYILNLNFEVKLVGILSEFNTDSGYMKMKIGDEYKYYNFKFEEKNIKDIYPNNKLFVSKQDNKYGFVDVKGNVVIDYIYDDARELNEYGYAAVKKDGLWGCIDSKGNLVEEPSYNLDNNLVIDFIGKWHLGLDLNMNYYCEK